MRKDTSPKRDDSDPDNEYIVGKRVCIYDQPGRALYIPLIASKTQFLFEVWAKSSDGKKTVSKWYWVDPAKGEFYEMNPPTFKYLGLAGLGIPMGG